mmetsp:Transcript_97184/g.231266  ORF Transcript_97184/g.231266 Transcript_97184/m.231266 type:complete len:258 (+) Transcript_97184:59-832(+)
MAHSGHHAAAVGLPGSIRPQPGIARQLLACSRTLLGVNHQQGLHQAPHLPRLESPALLVEGHLQSLRLRQPLHDLRLLEGPLLLEVVPRVHADRTHVEHHADGPNVRLLVVILLQHLGGHGQHGAHHFVQPLGLLGEPGGQAHVYELQGGHAAVVHPHVVLQLDVAVHDAVVVQIGSPREHLPGVLCDDVRFEAHSPPAHIVFFHALGAHISCQGTSRTKFHDQVEVINRLIGCVQAHNVGVGKLPRNLELFHEALV